MKPHSHEEHIRHTFDAFCKKVLRNEARDYLDEMARRRNREIPFSDLPVEAIANLPDEKRDIILLSYFLELSDNEIAKLLNMVRSSVAYRRANTLKLLKKLMGGDANDG